ncbi:cadherin domain-containing protein [Candidatus Poribacteria bacterium]|nr:cadherin domain-containing protein [Candidatus Poribacteria bacterium]
MLSIVTTMLLIYGVQGTNDAQAQNNAPELTPVKDRTQQVQDTIVALVPGVDAADDVTAAHLALITNLNLSDQSITALKTGDFDGLSALRSLSLAKNTLSGLPADIFSGVSSLSSLDLGSNQLSSLPDAVFSGLSAMTRLNLSYNSLDSLSADIFSEMSALTGLDLGNNQLSSLPANIFSGLSSLNWLSVSSNQLSSLPDALFSGLSALNSLYLGDNTVGLSIAVSLEKVGDNQFKATTAIGAPFDLVLPVTVTNGSIDGGATTITIPAGSIEGEPLTVIRTPGTSNAITAVIGTLPALPTSHFGYSLTKPSSADNTLSFALGIPKPTGDPNVNHAPIFTEGSSTTRSVAENTPAGKNIGSPVTATDADEDTLTYTLGGADAGSFGIVSTTGQLQTRDPLDYEKKNTYAVIVTVSDGSATDTIGVTIDVTDVEENNAPVFVEGSATERSVAENTPAGKNIGAPVVAEDEDEEDILTYSLSGVDAASFGIVSTTGQLQTRDPLDYEKKDTYSVAVLVSDGEGGTDTIGVAINVTDVEENNAPVFVEGSATERSIPENTPAGRNIGAPVVAEDADEEDVLTYSLSGVDAGSFGIVSTTGQLRTRAPLDYEQRNVYSVAVLVSDGNGGTDTIGVAINVTDVNETPTAHAPEFIEGNATERSVAENTPAGKNIGAPVTATDEDEDVLTYSLSGVDAASFGIVSTTGQLQTRDPLDYEKKNTYSVAVIVSDGTLTDTIGVAINITDVAENSAPVFASRSTERSIPENTPAGRNIGSPITATDVDGDTLTYSIDGTDASSFGIVSTTGQLQTSAPLDYEKQNAYSVTVTVSDGELTDSISVGIKVTDVDENSAPVFAGSSTERSIPENTPAGVHIGEAVSAKDTDSGDTLTYTLSGTDAASFDIDGTTGQLKTKAALDYETKNAYSVIVKVSDAILTDTIRVAITIIDVDESSGPAFAGSRTTRFIKENTPAGVNVGSPVSATDEDDDTLTYTLSGTDAAAFSIVRTTGQLKTKAPLDFETKNAYTVTVTVSDGGRTDAITVAITIIDVDERTPTTDGSPPLAQGQSVISMSEIMFGSERSFTPVQWIELNNAGPDIINLAGWKLIIQNVASPELTGPVNATITFRDDFWGDAPRLWPNDVVLVVGSSDSNSKNLAKDQVYELDWRTPLPIGFWTTWLSTEGFYVKLLDDEGNLVDEAGNLDGGVTQWQLPYGQNRGKTRAGHRTSLIRRYANSVPLDGTQAGGWISAADANLTEDQLTYYGDKDDISTPGIGIVINDISPELTNYDVNLDGVVDISDLVMVAGRLGQSGPNAADVNGDGVVNVQDLILVAGALGQAPAAPSLQPAALATFTAADIRGWLTQAQGLDFTDPKLQSGIRFLEQLLLVLVPKETALLPNYPNPFNPETWIPYHLAKDADVALTIYAVDGQVVRRLALGHQPAGMYQNRSRAAYWDGRNAFGEPVASGVYFYTLTAGDFTATRKMLIRK